MHAYNYTHAYTCALIFSFLKTLKLTLVHTNNHILLTHTTYMIPYTHTYKHTCTHTNTYSHTFIRTHYAHTLEYVCVCVSH